MNFLDTCRDFIGVESTPASGARAAAEFAGDLCARAGLHVTYARERVNGVEELNLVARPTADIPADEFMLQTRLDTAPAGPFGRWTKTAANPFNASIYGETIFGLGAADAKLDFLCKLEAARSSSGCKFALVGTFGGHRGMTGAIRLLRRRLVRARRALVGAPTESTLVHQGSGCATVELELSFADEERAYRREHDRIETASSEARVFGGPNPIGALFEYLAQLPDGVAILDLATTGDEVLVELDVVGRFREPLLPKLKRLHAALAPLARELEFNPERIKTSDAGVRFGGAIRFSDQRPDADWRARLGSVARGLGATFSVKEMRAGFETDPHGAFAQGAQDILREMGLDSRVKTEAVTSEANVFHRWGIECLAWGPGRGPGNASTPNESVSLRELDHAVEFYRRMIERFSP